MDWMLVGTVLTWVFLFWFYGRWSYRFIMRRVSPRYALKYDQRQQKKVQERRARMLKKQERRDATKQARIRKWAEANADDPLAKSYLASGEVVSLQLEQKSGDEPDFAAELRRAQEADDKYKQRRENEKAAAELRTQQQLEWAIAHPESPEARRHLEEQLEEATSRLRFAESAVRHQKTMMGFQRDEDSPESILYGSELVEAEAKQQAEQELIRRLQGVLSAPLSASEEQ